MPKRTQGSKITITVYGVDRDMWNKIKAEAIIKELNNGELLNRIFKRYLSTGIAERIQGSGKGGSYGNPVQRGHYDGDSDGCWTDEYGTLRKAGS